MLTRWNPWNDIASLHRDLDALFGRFFSEAPQNLSGMGPAADGVKDQDGWRLSLALPGVAPEHIDVEVTGRTVRVRAERARETQGEAYLTELPYGRFEREFTLPDEIDAEGVRASYRYGMLELMLPLKEGAKPRKIAVTAPETKQLQAA
jgi:HSP20 family protein